MPDMRHIILWAAIALYAASIVTCILSVLGAWRNRVPFRGPGSAAYLNPLTYLFLGAGFLVSALAYNPLWFRGMFLAVGLLQIVAFIFWRHRARKAARQPGKISAPSN